MIVKICGFFYKIYFGSTENFIVDTCIKTFYQYTNKIQSKSLKIMYLFVWDGLHLLGTVLQTCY